MVKWLIGIFLTVIVAIGIAIGLPYKPKATLTWEAPVTYTDGTTMPAGTIKGYKLYFSPTSGAYTDAQGRDVGNVLTANIEQTFGILDGTYYFVSTAYTGTGIESTFSNEISSVFARQSNSPKSMGIK